MKKIAGTFVFALIGFNAALYGSTAADIQNLQVKTQQLQQASQTLSKSIDPLLTPAQEDLQKILNLIESSNNLPAFEGGLTNYTNLLNQIKSENPKNPNVQSLVENAQTQLGAIKSNVTALSSLAANLKNLIATIGSLDKNIQNISNSFQQLDGYIQAIEGLVPPTMCKDYKGTEVSGFIQPSPVSNVWNLVDQHGKYYVIDANVGLVGQGTEYVISRTVQGWIDKGILGPDGKVACMHKPTKPAPKPQK